MTPRSKFSRSLMMSVVQRPGVSSQSGGFLQNNPNFIQIEYFDGSAVK